MRSEYYTLFEEGYWVVYDIDGNRITDFLEEDDAKKFVNFKDNGRWE